MKPVISKRSAPAKHHRMNLQLSRESDSLVSSLKRLMTSERGKQLVFEVSAHPDSKVFIAGTFNDWNPTTHPLEHHPEDGLFRATLLLSPGHYEYKFVVDGHWIIDPSCPNWMPNEFGTLNSVVHV